MLITLEPSCCALIIFISRCIGWKPHKDWFLVPRMTGHNMRTTSVWYSKWFWHKDEDVWNYNHLPPWRLIMYLHAFHRHQRNCRPGSLEVNVYRETHQTDTPMKKEKRFASLHAFSDLNEAESHEWSQKVQTRFWQRDAKIVFSVGRAG